MTPFFSSSRSAAQGAPVLRHKSGRPILCGIIAKGGLSRNARTALVNPHTACCCRP
jgi:hypothetical protein